MNAVELALKLDVVIQESNCDEEARRLALDFVWFFYSGRLTDWSLVRIPKEAKRNAKKAGR